jgi:rhodanese-related sulfurtransferase
MTKRVPTESAEQIRFVARVEQFYPDVVIFAVPNGGGRSPMEATKLKEEGVRAGVPDLVIAEPRGVFHGLYIEMKRQKGGKVSKEQEAMHERLRNKGYAVAVCAGCSEAWEVFERYILEYDPAY